MDGWMLQWPELRPSLSCLHPPGRRETSPLTCTTRSPDVKTHLLVQGFQGWWVIPESKCNGVQSEGPLKIEENPTILGWGKGRVDDAVFKIYRITMAS